MIFSNVTLVDPLFTAETNYETTNIEIINSPDKGFMHSPIIFIEKLEHI